MKYLTTERFIVTSNSKEALRNYADNYDRIFGEKEHSIYERIERSRPTPPTVGQYDDGSWYWLDETWNYGDAEHYPTRDAAQQAQNLYCEHVLG